MRGTILTLGGGGFSMPEVSGADVSPLDDFLLSLTGVTSRPPKVCFLGTASGDADSYLTKFQEAFEGHADYTAITLFNNGPEWALDASGVEEVLNQDVVYVGGGSTANLLALWRLHGLDTLLSQAAEDGTVLAGISAGMNCWYEGSSTDSYGRLAALPDGLGLLPGSACPHYFGEEGRQEAFQRMVATGELPDGHAADDGVALLWRDGELVEAVSETPGGQAFRVTRVGDSAVEEPLPVRFLR